MPLNRNPKPDFKVSVEIRLPSGELEETINATCRYTKGKEYRAILDEEGTDADKLAKLYKSWDNSEFECTPEGIADLIEEYPSAGFALFGAYRKAYFDGARKNS